jgi:hypothetical protein
MHGPAGRPIKLSLPTLGARRARPLTCGPNRPAAVLFSLAAAYPCCAACSARMPHTSTETYHDAAEAAPFDTRWVTGMGELQLAGRETVHLRKAQIVNRGFTPARAAQTGMQQIHTLRIKVRNASQADVVDALSLEWYCGGRSMQNTSGMAASSQQFSVHLVFASQKVGTSTVLRVLPAAWTCHSHCPTSLAVLRVLPAPWTWM